MFSKVLAVTADGASVNRRLLRLHQPKMQLCHKTTNPFADDRPLLFISDPPHLIKTVRNCWASDKRNLWVRYNVMYMQFNSYVYECRKMIIEVVFDILNYKLFNITL